MIISEQGLSVPKGKAICRRKSSSLSNVKKLHCLSYDKEETKERKIRVVL